MARLACYVPGCGGKLRLHCAAKRCKWWKCSRCGEIYSADLKRSMPAHAGPIDPRPKAE